MLSNQKGAILDYGSLIYITLQRSKTARHAIHTMVALMDEYGYASEGESFSIADRSGEVWIMEVIGRGTSFGKLGAVWVARRVPPGFVTAHANQARIQTFPRDDPDNCMYSDDVVDVAIHYGLFPQDEDPSTFSFSDVYCPVTTQSARFSEARVWSAFSEMADDSGDFRRRYLDYATGRDISNRMPLWIRPFKKLSLMDLMAIMNSHYEGTELDSSLDVGAGLHNVPYRPRPLGWSYEGKLYHNERTIFMGPVEGLVPHTTVKEPRTVSRNPCSTLTSQKPFGFKIWCQTLPTVDGRTFIRFYEPKLITFTRHISTTLPTSISKHLRFTLPLVSRKALTL